MSEVSPDLSAPQTTAVVDEAAPWERRYDVDWLRTLAMGLLMIYHGVTSFQPWAASVGFPQNEQSLGALWSLMVMVNVWRIPIVFLISGMGVRFAMERRDWRALLKDRTLRILLPFVFGVFFITPVNFHVANRFYGSESTYYPNSGHLWFLGNIFVYVLLLLPLLFYLKHHSDNALFRFLRQLFGRSFGPVLLALPLMVESWILKPALFVGYQWGASPTYISVPAHGFWLGMICFFTGFLMASTRDAFWPAAERTRWFTLGAAFSLYLVRLIVFVFWLETEIGWLMALESMLWMLALLGHGSTYLKRPSRMLRYFSQAVYPVYIVHLPVQFTVSCLVLPLSLPALVKLPLLLAGTFGISLLLYEILKRIRWARPFFGMKVGQPDSLTSASRFRSASRSTPR